MITLSSPVSPSAVLTWKVCDDIHFVAEFPTAPAAAHYVRVTSVGESPALTIESPDGVECRYVDGRWQPINTYDELPEELAADEPRAFRLRVV